MQAYIITEKEKQAVLTEMELEACKKSMLRVYQPTQQEERLINDAIEQMHRRFHGIVCRLLS